MKLAVIAFFAALGLALALSAASLLGYDARSIGILVSDVGEGRGAAEGLATPAPAPPPTGGQLNPVPSGTFKGPTAQPTMVGPSGPPPNE